MSILHFSTFIIIIYIYIYQKELLILQILNISYHNCVLLGIVVIIHDYS